MQETTAPQDPVHRPLAEQGAGQMLVHPRVPTAPMAKPLCPPGPARVPPAPPGLTAKEAPRVQVALVQRTPSAQGTLPV